MVAPTNFPSSTAPVSTETPQAVKIDYRQRDLDLFHEWKKTGSKKALGALVGHLQPIIFSEVRRASGSLPETALSAEAKYWAVRALQTYDPDRGVAVSTHVMNYLPKVRRLNYKYQNMARLPENLHLQYTDFQNTISHLENTLNREPTDDEIAKHMGWSKGAVIKFKGSLYEDLLESGNQRPLETSQFNSNKFLLDHILSKLDDQEKTILLEKGKMPASELAAKLGVNVSRLNYLSAKLRDKIHAIKAEIKMY
jgi:DNA-directed RNA polymerase specialized sigma subunit